MADQEIKAPDFTGTMDLLPEGALPIYSCRYVRYIDPDTGESFFTWKSDGNQPLSVTVGDLTRITYEFLRDDETISGDGDMCG